MAAPRPPFDFGALPPGRDVGEFATRIRRLRRDVRDRLEAIDQSLLSESRPGFKSLPDDPVSELAARKRSLIKDFKQHLRTQYERVFGTPIDGLVSDSVKLCEYLESGDRSIQAPTIGLIMHFSADRSSYKACFMRLLEHERTNEMRMLVITALGSIYKITQDISLEAVFKEIIMDEKECDKARRTSYVASLSFDYILKNSLIDYRDLAFPDDVDWSYVARLAG